MKSTGLTIAERERVVLQDFELPEPGPGQLLIESEYSTLSPGTERNIIMGKSRALPCAIGRVRCGHQDLIELFAGRWLRFEANRFGIYRMGGAQLYLTSAVDHVRITNNVFVGTAEGSDLSTEGRAAKWGTYDYNVTEDGSASGAHSASVTNAPQVFSLVTAITISRSAVRKLS